MDDLFYCIQQILFTCNRSLLIVRCAAKVINNYPGSATKTNGTLYCTDDWFHSVDLLKINRSKVYHYLVC